MQLRPPLAINFNELEYRIYTFNAWWKDAFPLVCAPVASSDIKYA